MKKWLVRGLLSLGILIILLIIGGSVFISNQAPDYDEKIRLDGLTDEVDIYYDNYAIPHIYASTTTDAYKALGYVHAKDRLWQMEMLRRVAPGRLSEILGTAALENDRLFRTIGLGHQSKLEAASFMKRAPQHLRDIVLGYIEGVNYFIAQGNKPVEYRLLGLNMTPYTLEDVYNVAGYMAYSFTISHRTEPIVDYVLHKYGSDYLKELDMHVAPGSTTINSESEDYSPISLYFDELIKELPLPELVGSNSWVIGPERTSTGSVLFANDPHIGFAQPAVWYEAHLEAPDLSLYGNHLAGFPIAMIGHTRHHAIGITMFENDDLDYYRERTNPDNPSQYWAIDHWEKYETRTEIIKVKDGDDETLDVRVSRHGPVISDVVKHLSSDNPISMWWVYQLFPLRLIEATYGIIHSQTLDDTQQGASKIHAPGLNVMYGDIEGNIAWWAAAKLPIRPGHVNSKTILDGATGADDTIEFYEFENNPQSVNPKSGFVYSANNQSVSKNGTRHPGYYLPEDRGRRIVSLLSSKKDWTTDEVKEMLLDVTSENVPEIIASIVSGLSGSNLSERSTTVLERIGQWDGTYDSEKIEPAIYVKLLYHILQSMMGDELEERWETFNGTHLMKRSIQPMIDSPDSPWWDDITTTQIEVRSDILEKALQKTIDELTLQLGSDMDKWKWARVHTLEHPHTFNANPSIRSYFNVGPFSVPGGTEVINNFQFAMSSDGTYEVTSGPSNRRAINLSELENDSWGILPTGQSGNIFSPHYKDQAEMFVKGQFRKQLMNKDEIIRTHRYHTILEN